MIELKLPTGLEMPTAGVAKSCGVPALFSWWHLIVPELAAIWLAKHNTHNRRHIVCLRARYAKDMENGYWQVTHEGIAFDVDGELSDGQHTLGAIVDSGKPQERLVTVGLPRKAVEVINTGKIRTLAHSLQILGYEFADARTVAIARAMIIGQVAMSGSVQRTFGGMTDSFVKAFIDRHLEAITFAREFPRTKVPAMVAGLLARAFYTQKTDSLRRFMDAVNDRLPVGESRPGDRSARLLGRFMATENSVGSFARSELYRKAQRALRAYLDGDDMSKLYESEANLFPLPSGEQL